MLLQVLLFLVCYYVALLQYLLYWVFVIIFIKDNMYYGAFGTVSRHTSATAAEASRSLHLCTARDGMSTGMRTGMSTPSTSMGTSSPCPTRMSTRTLTRMSTDTCTGVSTGTCTGMRAGKQSQRISPHRSAHWHLHRNGHWHLHWNEHSPWHGMSTGTLNATHTHREK